MSDQVGYAGLRRELRFTAGLGEDLEQKSRVLGQKICILDLIEGACIGVMDQSPL